VQAADLKLKNLDEQISRLLTRRGRMEDQKVVLEKALLALDARLKGLYSKRSIELNFKLDL
jgi:hypothetical protein